MDRIRLREACKPCGGLDGYITPANGQDVVRCVVCGGYQYCAPKTETGKAPRSVSTTHAKIKPSDKARVFNRASGRCEICGARSSIMHVGHIVSVADGHRLGMTDDELNSDENLACTCEECNLGQGKATISLRLAMAIIRARIGK